MEKGELKKEEKYDQIGFIWIMLGDLQSYNKSHLG